MFGPISIIEPGETISLDVAEEYVKGARAAFLEDVNLWEDYYFLDVPTFWGMRLAFSEMIEMEDGEKYLLVVGKEIDFWKAYNIYIIGAYVGVLLLAILIALAMAHDLKTPLMAISGYAETLRNNIHTEKKEYYADLIIENVGYMNAMVEEILELAKNQMKENLETPVKELWKPFVKGSNTRNEERGTGIGFSIVKNIADIHGFEVFLKCENNEFSVGFFF